MKQLEENLSLLENKKKLLEKTSEKLMRNYREEDAVGEMSLGKLMRNPTTWSVWIVMCISEAIPTWCLRGITKLGRFKEKMRPNWTGPSK